MNIFPTVETVGYVFERLTGIFSNWNEYPLYLYAQMMKKYANHRFPKPEGVKRL